MARMPSTFGLAGCADARRGDGYRRFGAGVSGIGRRVHGFRRRGAECMELVIKTESKLSRASDFL